MKNKKFLEKTLAAWQAYSKEKLTLKDANTIIDNITCFLIYYRNGINHILTLQIKEKKMSETISHKMDEEKEKNKPFHEKYRPEDFDDIIGNEMLVKILKTKIKDEGRPNVYLFHGPSGCGKTTIAKIISKKFW